MKKFVCSFLICLMLLSALLISTQATIDEVTEYGHKFDPSSPYTKIDRLYFDFTYGYWENNHHREGDVFSYSPVWETGSGNVVSTVVTKSGNTKCGTMLEDDAGYVYFVSNTVPSKAPGTPAQVVAVLYPDSQTQVVSAKHYVRRFSASTPEVSYGEPFYYTEREYSSKITG